MSQFSGLWRQGPSTPACNTSNRHITQPFRRLLAPFLCLREVSGYLNVIDFLFNSIAIRKQYDFNIF
jgi:hypothetical protein